MLRKLLKYELKSTARTLLPLYGLIIFISIIIRLFVYSAPSGYNDITWTVFGITVFLYGCAITAGFVVMIFVVVQRFYKNLLGKEGYLMHTLPVATWKNIASKIIIAFMWMIVCVFVVIASIFIISINGEAWSQFVATVVEGMGVVLSTWGIREYLIVFGTVVTTCVMSITSIMLIYTAISIGHLSGKYRVACAFGAYIAINIVVSTIISYLPLKEYIATLLFDFDIWDALTAMIFNNLVTYIPLFIGYFFITNYILKNKLNIE